MGRLIVEAKRAREHGEYAISAAVVKRGRIVSVGVNHVKLDADPSSHAEIVAIRQAVRVKGDRYLPGCWLYTTHEPCPMCLACALWAGLAGVVYGATQEDIIRYGLEHGNDRFKWRGARYDKYDIINAINLEFKTKQLMREECCQLFHNK